SAPESHIEVEYRHLGTTADIYFKWDGFFSSDEVFIELKYDLNQKGEYDRLIGQIVQINPMKHKIIVVLCGDHPSASLVARLREHYKKTGAWVEPAIEIIVKNAEEDAARLIRRKKEEIVRKRQEAEGAAAMRIWLDDQVKKAREEQLKKKAAIATDVGTDGIDR